jgi:hypothetical protein
MAVFGYWIGFYAAVGGILGTLSNLSDGLCIAGSREARRKKKVPTALIPTAYSELSCS